MRNPFRRDLILLHPPAIHDFRDRVTFVGPLADAVPSTGMFEMYPVGLTSIAAFLERNHYNVQIVNLAYQMLRDAAFDVPNRLAALSAPVFGIDLHWLPHAHGALAIAELVKRLHPESRVLMGGLSASYYHEELVRYPFVDFVLRGDSTEEPARQLLCALRNGAPLDNVENLTWKRADGSIAVNPLTFVPSSLDYVDLPAYRYMLQSAFKYRRPGDLIPYLEWLRYPITLLLTARGCTENCAACGGSRAAYKRICGRRRPAFRSPEALADDVRTICSFSAAPIFVVHDLRMGGYTRALRFLSLVKRLDPPSELVFELFYPADERFFQAIRDSVRAWSLQITLESGSETLRRINGKLPWPNTVLEATMRSALAHGCRKLDVFFMVGLPHQGYDDVMADVDHCEHLIRDLGANGRLHPFLAPLGPFLDPGSRAFEEATFGYVRFCRTLEDHRHALLADSWPRMLSYETDAMSRDEIVRATYHAAERLNDLKHRYALIDDATHAGVAERLAIARALADRLLSDAESDALVEQGLPEFATYIHLANHATMFERAELTWPLRRRFRLGLGLARMLAAGLVREVGHTFARVRQRYDVAPAPAG